VQTLLFALLTGAVLIDSETFDKSKIAYEKARYEDVVKLLRDADVGALTLDQRAEARFMLGVSELASTHDSLSQKAFIALYIDDPDYETPPYTAKKILAALDRAKRQVIIELEPTLKGDTLEVCGRGLSRKADVKVVFTMPEGEEGGPSIPDGRCFRQALPTSGRATGFYIVASVEGEVRATSGSRAQPLPIDRKKQALAGDASVSATGTPWYKHWATWAVVGILVAGGIAGGVAGGIIANQHANDPGTLQMNFVFPGASR